MTFYQELQLNQAGSKALIKASKSKKEKHRHIAVYLFKILLTVAFCTAFVMAFGAVFGEDNNIVGVVMLLCVLSFRYADLGIKNKDAMWAFAVIFAILAAGPRLANACGLVAECMIHIVCIMAIMILSCHNVLMFNHATLVLGYLLLYGYDVTGEAHNGIRIGHKTLSVRFITAITESGHLKERLKTYLKKWIFSRQEHSGSCALHLRLQQHCFLRESFICRAVCGQALQ